MSKVKSLDELLAEICMDNASDWTIADPYYLHNYDGPSGCRHKWKPILLLNTTVYDCDLCGMKKEECDEDLSSF